MNNPLLYIPIETMEPEPQTFIVGFVKEVGFVYGRYLAYPFPQIVSNETGKLYHIDGWCKRMKENYCIFIKAEGENKNFRKFKIHTTQRHMPFDILWLMNYNVPAIRVNEYSVQIKDHEFVTEVQWITQDDEYHYDLISIPKGEFIRCESNPENNGNNN